MIGNAYLVFTHDNFDSQLRNNVLFCYANSKIAKAEELWGSNASVKVLGKGATTKDLCKAYGNYMIRNIVRNDDIIVIAAETVNFFNLAELEQSLYYVARLTQKFDKYILKELYTDRSYDIASNNVSALLKSTKRILVDTTKFSQNTENIKALLEV